MSELDDGYTPGLDEGLDEFDQIKGALMDDTIRVLGPDEPIAVGETSSVSEVVQRMMAGRRAAVLIVDGDGKLSGIFTERDVLTRVVARGLDPARTPMAQVMTREPEGLAVGDRVAYAVNQMSVAGYRTIPLVDADRRPVGVVTVNHIIKWMATLFPEAVLNLRPGDAIKHPSEVDAG
jgi:CBS domain-containing protein